MDLPVMPTFERTKDLARSPAARLAASHPDLVVDRIDRSARAGRVYIDWIQNTAARSTVAPYSLRSTPLPLVSTPVTWDEVEEAARTGRDKLLWFGPADPLRRLDRLGDLVAEVLPADGGVADARAVP